MVIGETCELARYPDAVLSPFTLQLFSLRCGNQSTSISIIGRTDDDRLCRKRRRVYNVGGIMIGVRPTETPGAGPDIVFPFPP